MEQDNEFANDTMQEQSNQDNIILEPCFLFTHIIGRPELLQTIQVRPSQITNIDQRGQLIRSIIAAERLQIPFIFSNEWWDEHRNWWLLLFNTSHRTPLPEPWNVAAANKWRLILSRFTYPAELSFTSTDILLLIKNNHLKYSAKALNLLYSQNLALWSCPSSINLLLDFQRSRVDKRHLRILIQSLRIDRAIFANCIIPAHLEDVCRP